MEALKNDCQVLLVIYPGQSHMNPSLQLAKRLINLGVKVTLSTSLTTFSRIRKVPTIQGLTFAPFFDGNEGKVIGSMEDYEKFDTSIRTHGTEFVDNLIKSKAENGCPFTRVIYTFMSDWVALVAKINNVPSTVYWVQAATVFDIYYYRFTNFADHFKNCSHDQIIELPGLPQLSPSDLPSFVGDDWASKLLENHLELLNSEGNPSILVNSFDALEPEALRALKNVNMVGIGPSIPSAFIDEKDPSDKSFGADIQESSANYMEWLDARPNESVIYIAFGSDSEISSQLMEEIAQGLIKCGRPFLWVIKKGFHGEKLEEKFSCKEELEKLGKIVSWCSQVEVLHHPATGCFLSHCGWNSTIECLASGVPVVACPIWNDQICNAKLVQDVWKTGVKVNANVEGNVERDEFSRCVEIVMGSGEKGEELRKNAKKWRGLAKEAVKDNGSSDGNLKAYVRELLVGHC